MARLGRARLGKARHGQAWQGEAWQGKRWSGEARPRKERNKVVRKALGALVALIFAGFGALALASPAQATNTFSLTADGSVCGEVTLSGTPGDLPGNYLLHWFVEGDSENESGNFQLPGTRTISFDEDYLGGEIQVVYSGTSPESDENILPAEVTVQTDCESNPTPTPTPTPTSTPGPTAGPTSGPTVDPSPTGTGDELSCSDFDAQQDAQAVYDANPDDPHQLDGDGNGIACESLPQAAVPASQVDGDGGSLPQTGSTGSTLIGVSAGLLALGAAALLIPAWWARRRRNQLLNATDQ